MRRSRAPAIVWWGVGCTALAALSLLWTHTLTYDPWSWVLWGRELVHGSLATADGTSWKPLPALVDAVFSLPGDGAAPVLWLVVARAGCLLALVVAYRLGARAAGPLAGALAVVWVAAGGRSGFGYGFAMFFGTGWSEGLLVALSLGALHAQAQDRPRLALVAWFGAALIRPEAAVFLVLFGLLAVRRDRGLAPLAAGLVLAAIALWLAPDALSAGSPLQGSSIARSQVPPSIAHAAHPGLRDLAVFRDLLALPTMIGTVAALVLTRAPARRLTLTLFGVAAGWAAIVALMTELGYPGLARFYVVPVVLVGVLGAIGWATAARLLPARSWRAVAAAAAVAVNVVFLAGQLSNVRHQVRETTYEARLDSELGVVVARLGGAGTVRRCGGVSTNPLEVPEVAWELGLGSRVGMRDPRAGSVFRTVVFAQHVARPAIPSARRGFARVARVGLWTVYARCRSTTGVTARGRAINARAG